MHNFYLNYGRAASSCELRRVQTGIALPATVGAGVRGEDQAGAGEDAQDHLRVLQVEVT